MNNVFQITRRKRKNKDRSRNMMLVSYDIYTGLFNKHRRLERDHENLSLAYELLQRDFEKLYNDTVNHKNENGAF